MKSRKDIGPSRAMRSFSRSSRGTELRRLISRRADSGASLRDRSSPTRSTALRLIILPVHGRRPARPDRRPFLQLACASPRGPPSDPGGLLRRRLRLPRAPPRGLEGRRRDPSLYAARFCLARAPAGRRPGLRRRRGLPSRLPSTASVSLSAGRGRGLPAEASASGRVRLQPGGAPPSPEIRGRFASLGRTENVLSRFPPARAQREAVFGLLLTGRGRTASCARKAGDLRAVLTLAPAAAAGPGRSNRPRWSTWVRAASAEPLFEDGPRAAGLGRVHKPFPAERRAERPGSGRASAARRGGARFRRGRPARSLRRRAATATACTATAATARSRTSPRGRGVGGQEGEAVGALAVRLRQRRPARSLRDLPRAAEPALSATAATARSRKSDRRAGVALDGRRARRRRPSTTTATAMPDLYVLVYGHPDHGPDIRPTTRRPTISSTTTATARSPTSRRPRGRATPAGASRSSARTSTATAGRTSTSPTTSARTRYLHNNGDGTFTQPREEAGVLDAGFGMGVAIDDYDGDGRLDLFVSNYSFPLNWFLSDPRYPMPAFP